MRRDAKGRFRRATDEELGSPPGFRAAMNDRFVAIKVAHNEFSERFRIDLVFLSGQQWPPNVRESR